jgi:sugar transferase (PEP-CTERM/EpsH1 system associated)
MEDILFLAHRIPFPPNKGDKIRSYHLLKYLSGKYNVHLAAFIDNVADWRYEHDLSDFCKSTFFRQLNTSRAKLKSLRGFLTGQALSLPYYQDRKMQERVDSILRKHDIELVMCFSSVMAQYVTGRDVSSFTRIADFVDMDSDKWRQYSNKCSFPMNLIYAREANRLRAFEESIASEFEACLFVSAQEAKLFSGYAPKLAHKIGYFNNGVDFEYFDPATPFSNPLDPRTAAIVFTGAMDYWANIDAVVWFAEEVLPLLREKLDTVSFYIVGSNPAEQVLELAKNDAVIVTGEVPDTRPYLAHADLVVAPLRIARGIQNKVLEALAMSKPVVLTRAAMEGIDENEIFSGLVANDAASFADACVRQFERNDRAEWGRKARDFIKNEYSWEKNLARLDQYIGRH